MTPDPDEGKGPGYAIIPGLLVLTFGGIVTWAAFDGAVSWWAAGGVDVALVGAFVWLMRAAQWAREP